MSSESSLDIPIGSRDDLSIDGNFQHTFINSSFFDLDRKSRRQRRASSDILKSPKEAASSLFSKLSFSTELLNSKSLQLNSGPSLRQKLSSSNYSLNRPITSSHISIGSNTDNSTVDGRISRWQISFDAVLGINIDIQ